MTHQEPYYFISNPELERENEQYNNPMHVKEYYIIIQLAFVTYIIQTMAVMILFNWQLIVPQSWNELLTRLLHDLCEAVILFSWATVVAFEVTMILNRYTLSECPSTREKSASFLLPLVGVTLMMSSGYVLYCGSPIEVIGPLILTILYGYIVIDTLNLMRESPILREKLN
jgi:hypothetical protein